MGLAAGRQMQHGGELVQEGIQLPKGDANLEAAKPQAFRRLLKEASAGACIFQQAPTSMCLWCQVML